MNKVRLYGELHCNEFSYEGRDDDPEVETGTRIDPLDNLRDYLHKNGRMIRESDYYSDNPPNKEYLSLRSRNEIFKVKNAYVFLMTTEYGDDIDICPDKETYKIRIYSPDSIDNLVEKIIKFTDSLVKKVA